MSRAYVSDMIGEEYLTWKEKDQIILATPTGSGKTTFVVSKLLQHAVALGKHIVYYCNRRVLRDQFTTQSMDLIRQVFGSDPCLTEEAANHLHIFTYQGAEDSRNYPNIHYLVAESHTEIHTFPPAKNGLQTRIRHQKPDEYEEIKSDEIMYYIFDEAHYFLADSLIRHEGNFWAERDLNHGISVFLTATPKLLHLFLAMRESLPFSHDFTTVFSSKAKRTSLENRYDQIEGLILSILESWKVYDKVSFTLKTSPERKAAFMRRWLDPISHYFWHIEKALKDAGERPHYYRTAPDYSYLDVRYFTAYEELLPRIAQTQNDKWIVFVDSEESGNNLLKMIKAAGIGDAALLSSNRIKSSKTAQAIYTRIVEDQKFPCRILISTSVMDCGTNIHDPEVRHMAIASDNETTFLQELGRKRIEEGERLQLYVRVYSYKQIHTRYFQLLGKLSYILKVALKNHTNDTNRESYLSANEINNLVSEICSGLYGNLMCAENKYGYVNSRHESVPRTHNSQKQADLDMLLDGLSYSRTALTYVVYRLYDYNRALSTYRKEVGLGKDLVDFIYGIYNDAVMHKLILGYLVDYYIDRRNVHPWDPFYEIWKNMLMHHTESGELNFDFKVEVDNLFYLKHQLSWIGKEYDPSCWLFSAEKRMELISLLDAASESRPLRQGGAYHEQDDFAEMCKDLMLALPIPPKQLHRNRSRYKNGNLPGRNLLNKYLQELDLPYEIDGNKQELFEGVDKKKTVWTIICKDVENTPEIELPST